MRSLVILAALTLVAGCTVSQAPLPAPSSSSSSPASVAPSSPAAHAATSTPSATLGKIGGRGVTLPSGVAVSVGKISTYPDPSLRSGVSGVIRGGDLFTVVPVTLANEGTQSVDVTLTAVTVTASGEQASPLGEPDRHPTNDHFQGVLLPGKHQTATFGYVLRKGDLGHLQVEVWPTQSEPHAILLDDKATE